MTDKIQNILESIGYSLSDRGEYWQCSALYRGGDNPNALQIYKDSGVWKDYVQDSGFMPFNALVEKTVGKVDCKNILSNFSNSQVLQNPKVDKHAQLEKVVTFSKDEISSLLPHYSFYNQRGISDSVLKFLSSGMCTFGSMYQRYVFPIFNKHHQVHGVAGRDMSQSTSRPKWKHLGKKTQWIYPLFVKDKADGSLPIFSSILDCREIILVESIGDLLSLHEHGIKNVLVTFGTSISPSLCSTLMGLSPEKIILSFNNDSSKEVNAGKLAAVKSYLKLLSWFSAEKISICLPSKNDFGDMSKSDLDLWLDKKNSCFDHHKSLCKKISSEAVSFYNKNLISKNLFENIKMLSNYD